MRKLFFIVAITILAISNNSCKDFLDRQPLDFMSPSSLSTETDIINALNGTYQILIFDKKQPWALDFMVDVGYCNDPSYGEVTFWNGAQTSIGTGYQQSKWNRNYQGILRANTVLNKLDEISMPAANREKYRGEAYLLRSYFYGDLIEFYGDVPLRLKPESLSDKISPRVDKNQIFNMLISDLDSAAKKLPTTYTATGIGKMTKGAALALKARFYLYNKNYDKVIEACRAVMGLGVYSLHPSYAGLFLPANENNKEFIMTQQYLPNKDDLGLSGYFWTNLYAYGAYQVPYNMVDAFYMKDGKLSSNSNLFDPKHPFNNRDPRLRYVVLCPFDKDGYGVVLDPTVSVIVAGTKVRKFVDYTNTTKIHRIDGGDFPIIRYADVLLMLAEALIESGTYDYTEVTGLVDMIRQRGDVKMPKVANAEGAGGKILSTEELRQVIRHERLVEFPFEGLRWSDVKRWNIGAEVITGAKRVVVNKTAKDTTYTIGVLASRSFNTQKGYLWPIPELEIMTNPIANNPGY